MSVLDKFTAQETHSAQLKLDDLCDKHKVERFNIKHTGHKNGKWQALVLRMCGLDAPDATRGRPSDKNLEKVGLLAWFDQDLRGISPQESNKEIVKQYNLKPRISGHGIKSDVNEMIRTARKRAKKKIEKIASETDNNKGNPDTDKH